MSLFLLVAGDFVETGGMDLANYQLASFLADLGHEVHLVTHRAQQELIVRENVKVHRVPKPLNSYYCGERLLDRAGQYWAARIQARGGRVIVNGANCDWGDINWVHYVHAAYSLRVRTGLLRRVKATIDHRTCCKREARILPKARVVIANSERTKRDLVVHLGVQEERIRTVYLECDGHRFRPRSEESRAKTRRQLGVFGENPLLLFVGALGDRRKGFATAFDTWKMLCRDPEWDAKLLVAGEGAELGTWIERTRQAGLENRILFLGFRRDIPEVMAACDALVAPTAYEPYGLGVHEAICCGFPAFVTKSAGIAERYPRELEELLIPDFDTPQALALRLRRWFNTPARFGQSIRKFSTDLRSHSWNDVNASILRAVES